MLSIRRWAVFEICFSFHTRLKTGSGAFKEADECDWASNSMRDDDEDGGVDGVAKKKVQPTASRFRGQTMVAVSEEPAAWKGKAGKKVGISNRNAVFSHCFGLQKKDEDDEEEGLPFSCFHPGCLHSFATPTELTDHVKARH